MMDPEKPAGFFSTFSVVLDPSRSSNHTPPRSQRRNRRVYVCIPCHRRKLKCDKAQPCSRCVQGGTADACFYQQTKSSPIDPDSDRASEPRGESPRGGQAHAAKNQPPATCVGGVLEGHQSRGATHWTSIISEFQEARPYIFGFNPQWGPRYRQIKDLGYLFSPSSSAESNFPFGGGDLFPLTKRQIIESLPPRQVMESLIRSYFRSCEVTHRLLHPLQFRDELRGFWENPGGASDAWLAQLCMILALGLHTAPGSLFLPRLLLDDATTGRSGADWTSFLLAAAQLSLARSPYMAAPSLATIRTLCMMAMAGTLELAGATGASAPDRAAALMALVARLAATLQLHRSTDLFPSLPAQEAEARRRIWVTLQLIDLDAAIRSGNPVACRDRDADPPLDVDEIDLGRPEHETRGRADKKKTARAEEECGYTDGTFQAWLAGLLPLFAEVIDAVNAPASRRQQRQQSAVDRETAESLDASIRERLAGADAALALPGGIRCHGPDRVRRATIQSRFLHVLAHRVLLALGRCGFRDRHHHHPCSATATESALVLLSIQEAWTGSAAAAEGESWLADLCRDGFGAATLHVIMALRGYGRQTGRRGGHGRARRSLSDSDYGYGEDTVVTERVAWEALGKAVEAVRERAFRSPTHFCEFADVLILWGCLGSSSSSLEGQEKSAHLLGAMHRVADRVERAAAVSLANRQSLLPPPPWAEGITGPDEPVSGGEGGNFVLSLDSIVGFDPELMDSFYPSTLVG